MCQLVPNKQLRVQGSLAFGSFLKELILIFLATSSETLSKVTDEFQAMGSTIQQGGRLIDKYDRRQFADKILIALAFSFFFLVCTYIVNKRLFGGFNWFRFFFEFLFPAEEPLVFSTLANAGIGNEL